MGRFDRLRKLNARFSVQKRRLEPDTHTVVGTHHHGIADTGYTLEHGHHIYGHVVFDKFLRILVGFRIAVEHHQNRRLTFLGDYAYLVYLSGQEAGGFGHTVLHINGSHVGVSALLEIYCYLGRAVVGCRRHHIVHILGSVDLFLERSHYRVEHTLGIGACIGGGYTNCGRSDIRILLDREREKSEQTENHDEYRDNGRKHRAFYKC